MRYILFGIWILLSILAIFFVVHKEQIDWKKKKWICVWSVMAFFTIISALTVIVFYQYEIVSIVCLMIGYVGISVAAIVDIKDQRIPNYIVGAILCAGAVVVVIQLILSPAMWREILVGTVASGVLVFIVLYVLSVISRDGLGMGDVKLFTAIGFLCGAYESLNIMVYALLSCVLVSMFLVLTKKKKMKDKIAFGPFIYIGYIIVLLLGV